MSNTTVPILVPTLYLWIVDTLALQRGTWVIESGTKVGFQIWSGLELECVASNQDIHVMVLRWSREALFFLVSNTLVVLGMVAFDNSTAVLEAFPSVTTTVPAWPSPLLLVKALLVDQSQYDDDRVLGISQAMSRLKRKSRSFSLASATFEGRLRIDMVLL